MYLRLPEWIAAVERDYLRDYIPQGGAAVKFVVTPAILPADEVRAELSRVARASGLVVAGIDAAATKVHMIHLLFHDVARQMDWDGLAGDVIRRLLGANGFSVPGSGPVDYRAVAALNDYDEAELRRDVRLLLTTHVFRDYAMAQEFRIGMVRLCQARLEPAGSGVEEADAIKEWLRGELRSITTLRPALIFQRIARHNARDMFLSLTHWLRLAGRQGLLLTIDIGQYLADRRPLIPDGTLFHTTTAAMDAYEVFRQFIDATDELEGCFIVAIAPPVFLDDPKRGLERYDPLKLRIWDEVRDRRVANPLAALVRLTIEESA